MQLSSTTTDSYTLIPLKLFTLFRMSEPRRPRPRAIFATTRARRARARHARAAATMYYGAPAKRVRDATR